jgi:hypothetical protein
VTATFSAQEVAAEAGVPLERLQWLTKAGILKPRKPDRFTPADALAAA